MADNNPYNNNNYQDPYSDSYSDPYGMPSSKYCAEADTKEELINKAIKKSFIYMTIALAITALSAYLTSTNEALMWSLYGNSSSLIILCVVELIVVFVTSAMMNKNSVAGSAIGFLLYSIINGVTLSYIFILYDIGSVVNAFIITTVVFALMAVYGAITDKDLTGVGSVGMMLLLATIAVSFFNIFIFKSSSIDWIISLVVVAIFVGLTAYDVQKLKNGALLAHDSRATTVLGLYAALQLYLDFINIFIRLVSILGRSRD